MRVPDDLQECVCFVTARWGSQAALSSGFFVGVPLGVEDRSVVYLVTARHCVEDKDAGLASSISFTVNGPDGGESVEIETDPDKWLLHPGADVAVLPWVKVDRSVYFARLWPKAAMATTKVVEARKIGAGDDVFVTGLLVHHPGRTRVMPIVRLGCVAALPIDPVRLRAGQSVVEDVVALVEARSIGGLSGSPVFAHLPFWRDNEKGTLYVGTGAEAASGGESWLLGVMHGFYPVGENDPEGVSQGDENLNTGIAIVTRIDRVLDLIDDPEQVRLREAVKEHIEQTRMPKPTTKPDKPEEFERFEDLTRNLSNVPKKEIDEKRKDES